WRRFSRSRPFNRIGQSVSCDTSCSSPPRGRTSVSTIFHGVMRADYRLGGRRWLPGRDATRVQPAGPLLQSEERLRKLALRGVVLRAVAGHVGLEHPFPQVGALRDLLPEQEELRESRQQASIRPLAPDAMPLPVLPMHFAVHRSLILVPPAFDA